MTIEKIFNVGKFPNLRYVYEHVMLCLMTYLFLSICRSNSLKISTHPVTGSVLGFKTTASSNLPTLATSFAVPPLPSSSSPVSRKNTLKWSWRRFLWRWTVVAALILTSVERTCIRSQTHSSISTVRYRHCTVCVWCFTSTI